MGILHVNIIVKLLNFSSYVWRSQAYLHRLLWDWPMLVSYGKEKQIIYVWINFS